MNFGFSEWGSFYTGKYLLKIYYDLLSSSCFYYVSLTDRWCYGSKGI